MITTFNKYGAEKQKYVWTIITHWVGLGWVYPMENGQPSHDYIITNTVREVGKETKSQKLQKKH